MWQHFGQPLSHETWERDGKVNTDEVLAIAHIIKAGRVVLFPGDEYTLALEKLEATSPKLYHRLTNSLKSLVNL
tara:strand:+ start:3100 stop:3321 length:222 start_codon:yes stop_codon:yes gene_type:complete